MPAGHRAAPALAVPARARALRGGLALLVLALAGCTAPGAATDETVPLPPTAGRFDYQLGGASDGAWDVVVREPADGPLEGAYSICYLNGFQTQPDQAGLWADHPRLLLRDDGGAVVRDAGWPDEQILDITTPDRRSEVLGVLGPQIDDCAAAGFDAVDVDNLDTYERYDAISRDDALDMLRRYAQRAHARGLAVSQKNAVADSRVFHDGFGADFAVVEECGAHRECGEPRAVYGDHTLQVEYPDALAEAGMTFAEACADPGRSPLTILRDRELVPAADPDRVYKSC